MKGILLAGGSGTRLKPITDVCSKQLLPVYDKPMVYYPLSTLIMAGIKEIALVTTPNDIDAFQSLLGNGSKFGCKFEYLTQRKPNGIAEAFIIAEKFLGNDSCSLILGDNIFYGHALDKILKSSINTNGATIFAYPVNNPRSYGVVQFDKKNTAISLEEKPKIPKSNYAVPGIYFYDNKVISYAKCLTPSARGELEITDLNKLYLENGTLSVKTLERGIAWLDTGTFENLLQASKFVQVIEARQGLKVGCPEEEAWRQGFITRNDILKLASETPNDEYAAYLLKLIA